MKIKRSCTKLVWGNRAASVHFSGSLTQAKLQGGFLQLGFKFPWFASGCITLIYISGKLKMYRVRLV